MRLGKMNSRLEPPQRETRHTSIIPLFRYCFATLNETRAVRWYSMYRTPKRQRRRCTCDVPRPKTGEGEPAGLCQVVVRWRRVLPLLKLYFASTGTARPHGGEDDTEHSKHGVNEYDVVHDQYVDVPIDDDELCDRE